MQCSRSELHELFHNLLTINPPSLFGSQETVTATKLVFEDESTNEHDRRLDEDTDDTDTLTEGTYTSSTSSSSSSIQPKGRK